MWAKVARFIILNRLYLIIGLGAITAFLGYKGLQIEMTYDFAKAVPDDNEDLLYFNEFRKTFGEDANILAIGIQDPAILSLENFTRLKYLSDELAALPGINNVLSLPRLQRLSKDTENKKFVASPLFGTMPESQFQLDSLLEIGKRYKLYEGQVHNPETEATLILVSIKKEILNTHDRIQLVKDIVMLAEQFGMATGIEVHFAGLPYVRSIMSTKVKDEFSFFIYLSLAVTVTVLFLFFRSFNAVIIPTIVIMIIVVWVMGTIVLLDYKITLLTGIIPSIIIVIGIPNCIYLMQKYHVEYRKHQNKIKALIRIVERVGLVTLITNVTTAIGFLVLLSTDIRVLKEFGLVAGLNIFATFFVSIILLPSFLAYMPPPSGKQLKHLDFKVINRILNLIDLLVHRHRYRILTFFILVAVVAVYGMSKVEAVAYIVDDLPESSRVKQDLRFFEKNFSGVMPLEIIVNTGKKNGATKMSNLRKIEKLEDYLAKQPELSVPISIVGFAKTATFAYFNETPDNYRVPSNQERNFIFMYLSNQQDSSGLLRSFVDSTGQFVRVSVKMADIGSVKMDELINRRIFPEIKSQFKDSDLTAKVTGTTMLFLDGNKYLIENLKTSLIFAVLLISGIMAMLFGSFRMILISVIPNLLPLGITAGIMGFAGIPLKPSTALIFSIAFGIAVDDAIHFLAKYRQEMFSNKFFMQKAISISIKETGSAMIYTSLVLFFGFVIFSFSDFGGTVALGVLTSITLICAMFTNLLLLPALLLIFDSGKRKRKVTFEPLIEHYDEFYHEDEDEEINLKKIKVNLKQEE